MDSSNQVNSQGRLLVTEREWTPKIGGALLLFRTPPRRGSRHGDLLPTLTAELGSPCGAPLLAAKPTERDGGRVLRPWGRRRVTCRLSDHLKGGLVHVPRWGTGLP
jgi:hypothetical protein